MRGDWRHEAEQYRDLDRAAQERAEQELGAVMDGLAESVADLPDAEVLAEAREAGEDTSAVAARVQAVIRRAAQERAEEESDVARCVARECDIGYPCPLHVLAPRMVQALEALLVHEGSAAVAYDLERAGDAFIGASDAQWLRARKEARAILRELDGGA